MAFALELPKLRLDLAAARGGVAAGAAQPKFLESIDPPAYPFTSPSWCLPHKPRGVALLDVYKSHELLATYTVDQKARYLIGRNAVVCDIVLSHCSISRLHAALLHHTSGAAYLVDLGSCHGTFVDDVPLKALQPTLVLTGSVLRFGASSRSYTFKAFESRAQIEEMLQARQGLEPEEMELEHNTLMNKALSYRLGFSIPLSHQAMDMDAEGDDPMALCPPRQIEESSSAAALIRRTQSEDNTIAATFPMPPVDGHGPAMPIHLRGPPEPGRKRTRTQSAGLPTHNNGLTSALSVAPPPLDEESAVVEGMMDDADGPDADADADSERGRASSAAIRAVLGGEATPGALGVSKRVHFSERSPETIPSYVSHGLPTEEDDATCEATTMGLVDGMAGAMTCRREDVDFDLSALRTAPEESPRDVIVEP